MLVVLVSAFFLQAFIQYWQVVVNPVVPDKGKEIILGIVFLLILLAQSATGFVTEKLPASRNAIFQFCSFLGVMVTGLISIRWPAIYTITIFLCMVFFYINFMQIISYAEMVSRTDDSLRSVALSSVATANKIIVFMLIAPFAFLLQKYSWIFIFTALVFTLAVFSLYLKVRKNSGQAAG